MNNIKTMRALVSALLIFACFIVTLVLSIYFLSDDTSEAEEMTVQHIIYQSIGELGGYSDREGTLVKAINVIDDNIDNPEVEKIINCYTNNSVSAFREYLKAVNFSQGQFCKVQQNIQAVSSSHQNNADLNNNDRCIAPNSIIMNEATLKNLGRQYSGDFASDLASCKI
ncbi:hypothetical protein CW745_03320 [Psychromonas sp. psych-6C06]|uniref:hypothetical protein n=1 Tax=Psychromonas sp. psych-6C06 TaxID=2058089 RepID=UPI000C32825F|nr:hypothetical protein [Psychromonas sp. psych-6C06]PKF62476.1 hypothetical protein CW745_03320 [Psychromonas sp. psych-6C06]